MVLEARDDIASLKFHMTRAEKEIRDTQEYLLHPNNGIDAKLSSMENV